MKLLILSAFLTSCSVQEPIQKLGNIIKHEEEKGWTEYEARVTYYWPNDGGQIGTQTSTGNKAAPNKTIAVDPKIIPYGSKVKIPVMETTFLAHDTGAWVKSRKASKAVGRNNIVIDVFCADKADARQKIKKYPAFMKILVEDK